MRVFGPSLFFCAHGMLVQLTFLFITIKGVGMAILIERIRVLRPYLTNVQMELLCSELDANVSNDDVINAVLPIECLSISVSSALADYIHRHRLDDHLTVREFWDLTIEIDRMHNDGKSIDEMRDMVNERIGIS